MKKTKGNIVKRFFIKKTKEKKTYSNEKKHTWKKMWFVLFFQNLNLHPNKKNKQKKQLTSRNRKKRGEKIKNSLSNKGKKKHKKI